MDDSFRGKAREIGKKGLDVLSNFFDKKEDVDELRVRTAMQAASLGARMEHMDQMNDHAKTTHAIRIAGLLRNPEVREKYIEITQPQVKALTMARPEKTKK
jgi:hypothetical protein